MKLSKRQNRTIMAALKAQGFKDGEPVLVLFDRVKWGDGSVLAVKAMPADMWLPDKPSAGSESIRDVLEELNQKVRERCC